MVVVHIGIGIEDFVTELDDVWDGEPEEEGEGELDGPFPKQTPQSKEHDAQPSPNCVSHTPSPHIGRGQVPQSPGQV